MSIEAARSLHDEPRFRNDRGEDVGHWAFLPRSRYAVDINASSLSELCQSIQQRHALEEFYVQNATWLAGLAALLIAPAARADRQYTKWGMTPEQVVAASGGKAELLPPKRRPRIPPLETAASGEFQDGAMQLRTAFSFNTDGGGLACVSYGLMSHDGDEAFKTSLISRYGQPQRVSGLPVIGPGPFSSDYWVPRASS
jgi:hypothetical protein